MRQKVLKSGNSLVVSIPADFVRVRGLKPGDVVISQFDQAEGTLHFTFTGSAQLPLITK